MERPFFVNKIIAKRTKSESCRKYLLLNDIMA
jgi:hypothetical protein